MVGGSHSENCVGYVNLETARRSNGWRAIIVLVDSRAHGKTDRRGARKNRYTFSTVRFVSENY